MNNTAPENLQASEWAGDMGNKWNTYIEQFESMIAPVGAAAIEFGKFTPGETVIDIGCGGGASSFEIARRVAPNGSVYGLDVSQTLIDTANQRAAAQNITNLKFVADDAAQCTIDERFDTLFSRFGVMFFADPYAAFANMAKFVRPGGRLVLCCWGPPQANPWVGDLMAIARKYADVPQPDPRAPGPFAFSDQAYVEDILSSAGFSNIEFKSWNGPQIVGGTGSNADTAANFVMDALFVGDALKDASDSVRNRARGELSALLRTHESSEGVLLQANAWLISATI